MPLHAQAFEVTALFLRRVNQLIIITELATDGSTKLLYWNKYPNRQSRLQTESLISSILFACCTNLSLSNTNEKMNIITPVNKNLLLDSCIRLHKIFSHWVFWVFFLKTLLFWTAVGSTFNQLLWKLQQENLQQLS